MENRGVLRVKNVNKISTLLWLAYCAISILCVGCIHPTQAVIADTNPYGWSDTLQLKFQNGDSTTLRDINFVIRKNREFRDDSLHVEFTILTPDSCHYTEQVIFPMVHNRQAAALRDIDEMPYRQRVVLDRCGEYKIIVVPLKRSIGIEAAGINIIKSEL